MKLYVGNLSYTTTQDTLYDAFGAHGKVDEVAVITDRETGRARGFAFVSMNNDNEGRAAIEALNGAEVDGRTITVNEARPKTDRGGSGGGGRGSYGGGGSRGYGGGGGRGDRW
jgi:RNA recognition motif-containing protein